MAQASPPGKRWGPLSSSHLQTHKVALSRQGLLTGVLAGGRLGKSGLICLPFSPVSPVNYLGK